MPSPLLSKQYILDTNILRPLFDFYYPPELFPEIWSGLEKLEKLGLLSSVKAVKTECETHFQSNLEAMTWLKNHSSLFTMPTEKEQDYLKEILSHNEFKMSEEEITKGKTQADPLLVAKGRFCNGIVVTAEKWQLHGRKIPTVCKYYNVECIGRIEFIKILREISFLQDAAF